MEGEEENDDSLDEQEDSPSSVKKKKNHKTTIPFPASSALFGLTKEREEKKEGKTRNEIRKIKGKQGRIHGTRYA